MSGKISLFTPADPIDAATIFPVVQAGVDKQATAAQMAPYFGGTGTIVSAAFMLLSTFGLASTLTIPVNTNYVRTTGYTAAGDGGAAEYVYDAAVDATYVTAHPHTSFLSANSRGFRIVLGLAANLAQVGATAGADIGAMFQELCNLLPDGGLVTFPHFAMTQTSAVVAHSPVLAQGYDLGDNTTNTNGSGATSTRPIVTWTGSALSGAQFTISPAAVGNAIWGGGSDGIEWNGNGLAAWGVHLDNNIGGLADGFSRNHTAGGLDVSSQSGSTTNYSQAVRIRRWVHIWGSVVATTGGAHGVRIRGNGTTVPATEHEIGEIRGLVYNGNLLDISECDNLRANKVHGVVQSGGTGRSLRIHAGGAQGANNNLFRFVNGPVQEDAGLHGNIYEPMNSEGGGIVSGSIWHGTLRDYVTGEMHQSHRYKLQKKVDIQSGDFVGDAATSAADLALQWRTITFPDGVTSRATAIVTADFDLNNGNITGIEFTLGTSGTNTGDYRMRIRFSTQALNSTTATPEIDNTSTYSWPGGQYWQKKYTLTTGFPISFTKGDTLLLSVTRMGADALDTNTDAPHLLGVKILYTSTGPTSAGSGTYDVPNY